MGYYSAVVEVGDGETRRPTSEATRYCYGCSGTAIRSDFGRGSTEAVERASTLLPLASHLIMRGIFPRGFAQLIQGFDTQQCILCEDEKKVYAIYYVWYEMKKKEEVIYTFHARHILEPRRDRRLAMLDMLPTDIPTPRPLLGIVWHG